MGGRDHSCEVCGRGGFNDPDGACVCTANPRTQAEEGRAKRVKIAPEFVEKLSEKWSEPVQVMIALTDQDGDLELIFRTASELERFAERVAGELEARAEHHAKLADSGKLAGNTPRRAVHHGAMRAFRDAATYLRSVSEGER